MNRAAQDKKFFGHPTGLSTLFFTEMWERFSYYGLRPLLVLFMSAALLDGGFGIDRAQASAIVGIYMAGVYLSCLPGGWIADHILGLRKATMIGALLISLGHISIALSSFLSSQTPFFLGLILIVLGTGLLKPNISAMVGELYPEGGERKDAGFTIFYMGINIGAFLGQLVTGWLGETVGWHYGFGAAGIGMLFGLAWFAAYAPSTLRGVGEERKDVSAKSKFYAGLGVAITFVLILASTTGFIPLDPVWIASNLTYVLLGAAVLYFGYFFGFGELTTGEMKRFAIIIILFIAAAIFWSAFEQAPTSLNLFARDFTDRVFMGWTIPATWFQAINSFFIILLAPVFAALWVKLGKRGGDLSSPAKFALGLLLAGLGFVIMIYAAKEVIASEDSLLVSPMWLVLSYLLQTLGELCLSPVGLSAMTTLSPKRFVGQMMGIWFLAASIGGLIAGLVGGRVNPEELEQMPELFVITSLCLIVAAVVLFALTPFIKKYLTPKNEHWPTIESTEDV